MYWNNPNILVPWPNDFDPIVHSSHQGQHCLFYDPELQLDRVQKLMTLTDVCVLANRWLADKDVITDPGDLNKIVNTVRINQFVHSLQQEGNHKPILVHFDGDWPMISSTGGTRLMAAERCGSIKSFTAFISTHQRHRQQFDHLEEITTFDSFAHRCGAVPRNKFVFRFTEAEAHYGLDWYEVSLNRTTVPDDSQCLYLLTNYVGRQHSTFEFTPDWFDSKIHWPDFES